MKLNAHQAHLKKSDGRRLGKAVGLAVIVGVAATMLMSASIFPRRGEAATAPETAPLKQPDGRRLGKAAGLAVIAGIAAIMLFSASIFPGEGEAATAPSLGTADSFAVLAGSQIDNIPTSDITGDVGLSPAAGTLITGFTCAEVEGTIYAVDDTNPLECIVEDAGLLDTAKGDLTTAYDSPPHNQRPQPWIRSWRETSSAQESMCPRVPHSISRWVAR